MKPKTLTLVLIALLTHLTATLEVEAVVPPPLGGYPNFTTAAGDHALQALTLGVGNTAIGTFSLFSVTTGNFNTAVGAGSLDLNTADNNTAVGGAALLFNATGPENTAIGTAALEFNVTGIQNTASGVFALFSNVGGSHNTAVGANALFGNTGSSNTGIGDDALASNTNGQFNVAMGDSAGVNSTGDNNIIIGTGAGSNITAASNVICIGTSGENVSNTCYIANIFSAANAGGSAVFVNGDGQLHIMTSSERFKKDINPMNKASEAILGLKPVSFHYTKEIDPAGTSQFGLVAEDVEKANPDLVVRDKEGKPYSVRYDQVNAMLLNEFLKEHRTVQEQGQELQKQAASIATQQKQIEALAVGLRKVSAQLEVSKAAPQTVVNNR